MDPKIVLEGGKGESRVGKLPFFFFFFESGFLSVAIGCPQTLLCGVDWP